jgi:hypothetical protein
MVFTGPAARIPAEAPNHADVPSGTRGIRAKAYRVCRASFLLADASAEQGSSPPSPPFVDDIQGGSLLSVGSRQIVVPAAASAGGTGSRECSLARQRARTTCSVSRAPEPRRALVRQGSTAPAPSPICVPACMPHMRTAPPSRAAAARESSEWRTPPSQVHQLPPQREETELLRVPPSRLLRARPTRVERAMLPWRFHPLSHLPHESGGRRSVAGFA